MDYTEIPRSLIYEDLNDLIYFEVKTPKTINAELFFILKKELLRYTTEAKKYALECFNNAYYICTLVLLEEDPELFARKYQNNVLIKTQEERPDYDICAASMGLAYHLLSRCDDPKCSNKDLLDNIYLSFKNGEFTSLQARNTFFDIVDKYDVSQYSVPSSLFAPRDIIRAVANATEKDLVHGKEYIYERSCLLNDISREDYLFENIIKYLKEELHKIYDDYEYDENEKIFCDELTTKEYEKFNNAVTPIIEAIKYYEKRISLNHIGLDDTEKIYTVRVSNVKQSEVSHKSPEIERLQERIKVLNLEITRLQKKISEARQENENLKSAKESLETQYKELLHQLETDKELDEDTKLGIDERIIFVSMALGITLAKEDTNQTKLAKFISKYSGDEWKSIRSRIVNINKELAQERKTPGDGLSQGTREAVMNVKEWLKNVGREIAPVTNKMIKDIDDIYLDNKE